MSAPFNPGAVQISSITNAVPLEVTTSTDHNFVDNEFIVLSIPVVNGMLPPTYVNNPAVTKQIVSDYITVTGATTFTFPLETLDYSGYSSVDSAYAIPLTYICYANPDPTFQPAYRLITSISNATNAVITTSFDHDFVTGLVVRLMIPEATGMSPINQLFGTVTYIDATSFSIAIDTNKAGTFAIPTSTMSSDPRVDICALAVPIGSDNSLISAATRNVLT